MKMIIMNDLTGRHFGRLTIIKKTTKRQGGHIIWKALCICGKITYPTSNNLLRGISQSCGCLQREKAKKRLTQHGMCGTTEYQIWCGIIKRCYNPNCQRYSDYGGRGIFVCDRWRNNFDVFYKDMGLRPKSKSLDRWPDHNGGYEPGNVRWATPHEQRMNSRPKSYGPQKQFWFYGNGPNGEMIIDDNQSHVARIFSLTSTHISNCLSGKQKIHKGWRFERLTDCCEAFIEDING